MIRRNFMKCKNNDLIYLNNLVVMLTPEGLNMNNPRF